MYSCNGREFARNILFPLKCMHNYLLRKIFSFLRHVTIYTFHLPLIVDPLKLIATMSCCCRCNRCDRCFGQQTNLDRHTKKHESNGALTIASDAGALTVRREPLTASMRTAAVALPFSAQNFFSQLTPSAQPIF